MNIVDSIAEEFSPFWQRFLWGWFGRFKSGLLVNRPVIGCYSAWVGSYGSSPAVLLNSSNFK